MVVFALLGLGLGGLLAQRYPVFILWPAIAIAFLYPFAGEVFGIEQVPRLAYAASFGAGLQLGYLAGAFVREQLDPQPDPLAGPA